VQTLLSFADGSPALANPFASRRSSLRRRVARFLSLHADSAAPHQRWKFALRLTLVGFGLAASALAGFRPAAPEAATLAEETEIRLQATPFPGE
jgi:hypothetical protein